MSTIQICDVCSDPVGPDDRLTIKAVLPEWAWDLLGMPEQANPIDICGFDCLGNLATTLEDADANRDPGDGTDDDEEKDRGGFRVVGALVDEHLLMDELPLIPQTSGGMPEGISLVTDYPTGVTMRS